jgi:hypothetical protein
MDWKNHGKPVKIYGVMPEVKIWHLSGTFRQNNPLDN